MPKIAEKIVNERRAFRELLKDTAKRISKGVEEVAIRVFVELSKDRLTKE